MFLLLAGLASAVEGPAPSLLHRNPVGFGAGFVVGLPTGLSFAYRKDGSPIWFDAALAWRFDNGGGLLLQGDVEWTLATLHSPEWEDIHFPVYVGVGPRFLSNVGPGVTNNGSDDYLGLRVPVGMSVYHTDVPLEGFLELGPVIKLFPTTGVGFDIVVGARFYFGPG